MKKNRKTLMGTSIIVILLICGFIMVEKGTNIMEGLDLYILILIVIIGIVAMTRALKKDKEEKLGIPSEDEFSKQIKFKSGYYAYMASMYMWMFIFLFKRHFPDVETMLGSGILLSALIFYISKIVVKREFNEE